MRGGATDCAIKQTDEPGAVDFGPFPDREPGLDQLRDTWSQNGLADTRGGPDRSGVLRRRTEPMIAMKIAHEEEARIPRPFLFRSGALLVPQRNR